jgi:hypothetical protein
VTPGPTEPKRATPLRLFNPEAVPEDALSLSKEAAAPPKDDAPPSRLKRLMKSAKNVLILLAATIGGGNLYDAAVGDGPLPQFTPLAQSAPHLVGKLKENTTARLADQPTLSPDQVWQALQPSLDILQAVSPEIAQWVHTMHQENRLHANGMHLVSAYYQSEIYAGYDQVRDQLILGPAFWKLSNGHKAATLAHEFRHARQNYPKIVSDKLTQLITLRGHTDYCKVEDEAYLYQKNFYQALGIDSLEVDYYLHERGLNPIPRPELADASQPLR